MRSILILSLVLCPAFLLAQENEDIGSLLLDEEVTTETESVAPVTAPSPVISAPKPEASVMKQKVPTKELPKEEVKGDVYYYSYSPKDGKPYNYSEETGEIEAGKPGSLIFTLYGELVDYSAGRKNKGGASFEVGGQLNFFKYLSAALTIGVGAREGNEDKNNLYPIGVRFAPRVRLLPWLFPFLEGGAEFVKLARGGWEPPFWLYGAGLMFNMGAMDKKAEYNLNKTASARRTLLIIALDRIESPNVNQITPNAYVMRLGLSLEF